MERPHCRTLFQVSPKKDFNTFDSTTNFYHDTNERFCIFVKALRDGENSFFSKLSCKLNYVPHVYWQRQLSVICPFENWLVALNRVGKMKTECLTNKWLIRFIWVRIISPGLPINITWKEEKNKEICCGNFDLRRSFSFLYFL